MKAEIITIGTEVTTGSILNTNSKYINLKLLMLGISFSAIRKNSNLSCWVNIVCFLWFISISTIILSKISPLAVIIMMGISESLRIRRQSSKPSNFGRVQSSKIRSYVLALKAAQAA